MSGISKRERTLILAAVLVAVVIGIPGLLTGPGAGPAPSLAGERQNRKAVQAELAAIQAEVEELETDVERRVQSQPPQRMSRRLAHTAQSAARAAGVRIADLKPLPVEDASGLHRVPMQISLSGRFALAARFLYELQQRARDFPIEEFRITSTDPKNDQLTIELRLCAYVLPAEERADASNSQSRSEEDHAAGS